MQIENDMIVLDAATWTLLERVNHSGNEVKWTDDKKTWGVVDKWEFPKEVGRTKLEDCDGIVLYKIKLLLKEGFPAELMLFTVCMDMHKQGHAVLTIPTDRGDIILDNNFQHPMTYDALKGLGYKFLFRSKPGHAMTDTWEKIA